MAGPLGSAPGLLAAAAVGGAARTALEPAFEVMKQDAWRTAPYRVLELDALATLVAQGGVLLGKADGSTAGSAYDEAVRQGFSSDKLDRLIYLAQTAPDLDLTLELWRRGLLGPVSDKATIALVEHAFAKHQIEPQYWPALEELFAARVSPPTIAIAVQRGILENVQNPNGTDRLLTVTPDVSKASINSPGMVGLDVLAEAQSYGYDFDRLAVDARIAGIPPAPGELMTMLNRSLINDADFLLGVAEGDTRNEWADVLKQLRFRVLSGVEAAGLRLRGWADAQTSYDLGALDGWTQDRMDRLYELARRPLTVANITKALARGGTFNPAADEIQDPYSASVHQADLGPEWYDLAEHLKYSYPSAFVLRALAQAGDLGDTAAVEQILLEIGWKPDLAHKVAVSWTGGAGGADPHVTKAQGQLWTALHRSYVADETDDATATTMLGKVGVSAAGIPEVLALWQDERSLVRKQLTPAQLKKAWTKAEVNPATGAAWTEDEVVSRLVGMGYSHNDALTFLGE